MGDVDMSDDVESQKEMETRASSLLTMLYVADKLHGAALVARGVEAMPVEAREAVRAKRLLPSTWLPISTYSKMLHGFNLDDDAMRALARASAEHDVNTIYRVVFRFLPAETLARQTPKLFGIYYRGGDISVLESSKHHCRIDYRNCHGFDRLVWQDYVAGAQIVLELCGAKNVHTVVEDGGTGSSMMASARWE